MSDQGDSNRIETQTGKLLIKRCPNYNPTHEHTILQSPHRMSAEWPSADIQGDLLNRKISLNTPLRIIVTSLPSFVKN